MFEQHQMYKKYRAIVEGCLSDLHCPYEINQTIDNKKAVSEIVSLVKHEAENTTELEVVIKTGRKHQIRKHLSGLGFPIQGDRLYGAKNTDVNLQLTAINIRFTCPVTGELKNYSL